MEQYETKDAFVSAIEDRLGHSGWPEEVRRAAAQAIADDDGSDGTARKATAFELRVGRYFLRDDDAKFFEVLGAVGPVVATLATAGALAAPAAVTAAASVLGSLWRMWRKSGQLTAAQLAVVVALKSAGPMTDTQLSSLLVERAIIHSPAEIAAVLDQLKDIGLNDGTTIPLVKRTEAGLWRAVNL